VTLLNPLQRYHVHLKALQNRIFDLGQLLVQVENADVTTLHPQMGLEPVVSDGVDAGDPGGAQVNGYPVRLLVSQRLQNSFT